MLTLFRGGGQQPSRPSNGYFSFVLQNIFSLTPPILAVHEQVALEMRRAINCMTCNQPTAQRIQLFHHVVRHPSVELFVSPLGAATKMIAALWYVSYWVCKTNMLCALHEIFTTLIQ